MSEAKPKPKLGRPPEVEKRERIRKLHEAGLSQMEIAAALKIHDNTVRFHLRKLGIEPRPLRVFKANKVKVQNGTKVKECALCGETKELTEFKHPRHAVCAACRREQGWDKS